MKTIWKFPLPGPFVSMPEGAKIIHFGIQGETPHVWAEVEPSNPPINRRFDVLGTGFCVPEGYEHVGTWFNGPYVWHMYEVKEVAA